MSDPWLAVVLAVLSGSGLVALTRLILFRRAEERRLGADAHVLEIKARIDEETSEFGRVNLLLDRYERRQAELEKRQAELEKELAALREEVAELRPKARRVAELEEELRKLREELRLLREELNNLRKIRRDTGR